MGLILALDNFPVIQDEIGLADATGTQRRRKALVRLHDRGGVSIVWHRDSLTTKPKSVHTPNVGPKIHPLASDGTVVVDASVALVDDVRINALRCGWDGGLVHMSYRPGWLLHHTDDIVLVGFPVPRRVPKESCFEVDRGVALRNESVGEPPQTPSSTCSASAPGSARTSGTARASGRPSLAQVDIGLIVTASDHVTVRVGLVGIIGTTIDGVDGRADNLGEDAIRTALPPTSASTATTHSQILAARSLGCSKKRIEN